MRKLLFFSISVLVPAGLLLGILSVSLAEEVNQNATAQRKEELQQQLVNIDAQIDGYQKIINQKQGESASLERDISIFNAKIKMAKLEISRLEMEISRTNTGISKRSEQINKLLDKSDKEKQALAELLRKSSELDGSSVTELVLGHQNFSDFFVVTDSFDSIRNSIHVSLEEIRDTSSRLEKEKDDLNYKKAEQLRLKTAQEAEKKKLAANEAQKKKLLDITKGVEKSYQNILALRQKDAAKIRSQLFLLSGSPSISFEKAVEYANLVWSSLKVRPAFLLGIIREESNLGANVGKGNWKVDLAHSSCAKQRTAFVQITLELGLDPDLLPVSKKQWYGNCGGAMGPAQFMPTTWQGYKKAISKITGNNPPNPWNSKDAFVAAGLLLKDNGASAGTYEAERRAALKYLAGSNWNKPAYRFYGNDVMDFASEYQEQIDIINKSLAQN